MADIRPFQGIRYSSTHFGRDITDVVCPPFDIISAEEQARLYERHPRNVVRLELAREETEKDPGAKYQRAALDYRAWLSEGTLVPDSAPAVYPYLCSFSIDGQPQERRGIIVALRLEPWERRIVRPHERTLSGPIEDRLRLMKACSANFSPIWVISPGSAPPMEAVWKYVGGSEPEAYAQDTQGAMHRIWRCAEAALLRDLHAYLADQPVYVADGHHRYATALQYRSELPAGDLAGEDAAANFVLTYLVESADPGLSVTGLHRIARWAQPLSAEAIRATLAPWFELEEQGHSLRELAAALRGAGTPTFGLWAPGVGLSALARLKPPDGVPAEMFPQHSAAWRRLDVVALHALGIDRLFPEGTSGLTETGRLTYTPRWQEAEQAIARGEAEIAFLVRDTPVQDIFAVADAGDRMPEKSTYFYPKPLTGTVMAGLSGEISQPM